MNTLVVEYEQALREGRLLIQHCERCGQNVMYPKFRCPFCFSGELSWRPAEGSGTLYSFTVLRTGAPTQFAELMPYALGVVRLKEGVQVLGRLMPDQDGEWGRYQCDLPVELCLSEAPLDPSARPAPWFRPTLQEGRNQS